MLAWLGTLRRRLADTLARRRAGWDVSALLNAAAVAQSRAERHLWLVRMAEWLRSPGPARGEPDAEAANPWPPRRLQLMLNALDKAPEHRQAVARLLRLVVAEGDAAGLWVDHGFAPGNDFLSELAARIARAWVPATPDTDDLGGLLSLVFSRPGDAQWLRELDAPTVQRLAALLQDDPLALRQRLRQSLGEALGLLAVQVAAGAASPLMRPRIAPAEVVDRPFHALVPATQALVSALNAGDDTLALQGANYLRALLQRCRQALQSVRPFLETHGISVEVVFQIEQIAQRTERMELVLESLLAPQPEQTLPRVMAELLQAGQARGGVRALFSHHYSMLARKVTQRSGQAGEHYITRNAAEYRQMLRAAGIGGAVIAFTTLLKFGASSLQLPGLWDGVLAGVNYAASFLIIFLLHGAVATKQPAMTAPALAEKLPEAGQGEAQAERFVDEVAALVRSQFAGIAGNLLAVVPVVLALQGLAWGLFGAPWIDAKTATYALHHNTVLGPTLLYAAFTGVVLFTGSLVAGWMENAFVLHRVDSRLAWNPTLVAWLGAARAQRWARWWREHISAVAANGVLGLMLGLVPALAAFAGLPLEVRHVTLVTGQVAAAAATLGAEALTLRDFWGAVAAIPFIGLLNLAVSFALALTLAMRSRGLRITGSRQVRAALVNRLMQAPRSFLLPPREGTGT